MVVCMRDAIDCGHCICLAASRKEKLRRLIQVEKEKAADKHDERNCAKSDIEVSPSHILSFIAARRRGGFAGEQVWIARIVGNEAPGNQ